MSIIKAFGGKNVTRAPKGGFQHPANDRHYKGGQFCPLYTISGGSAEAKRPLVDFSKGIPYVAIVKDLRARTTTREFFQAKDYQEAKAIYKRVGNVESHFGPVTVNIVGTGFVATTRTGEVVTLLNDDNSIGEVSHVVTAASPSVRCFFE